LAEVLDEVLRRGDEAEVLELAPRIVRVVEPRDALRERDLLALEVVEVALDRHVEHAAHRRGAGVEVDQDRRRGARQTERKVHRKRGLADSALAGGDRYNAAHWRAAYPKRLNGLGRLARALPRAPAKGVLAISGRACAHLRRSSKRRSNRGRPTDESRA
jgi:hypothetical protein